jgi:hypothetical protein
LIDIRFSDAIQTPHFSGDLIVFGVCAVLRRKVAMTILAANDFCARALKSWATRALPEEPQSCFRMADALQHFFLAFP